MKSTGSMRLRGAAWKKAATDIQQMNGVIDQNTIFQLAATNAPVIEKRLQLTGAS